MPEPGVFSVIGIDPSLRATGIAAIANNGKTSHRTIVTDSKSYGDSLGSRFLRIADITHEVESFMRGRQLELIVIEGYAFHAVSASASVLIELGAILRDLCLRYCPTIEVAPARLKLFAARNGRADKKDVIKAVEGEFGISHLNDHEADAMAAAWLAASIQGYFTPCIERQREIADECAQLIY